MYLNCIEVEINNNFEAENFKWEKKVSAPRNRNNNCVCRILVIADCY